MIWDRWLSQFVAGERDFPLVVPVLITLFAIVTAILLLASIIGGVAL